MTSFVADTASCGTSNKSDLFALLPSVKVIVCPFTSATSYTCEDHRGSVPFIIPWFCFSKVLRTLSPTFKSETVLLYKLLSILIFKIS